MALNSDKFNCKKCPFGKHCDNSNPAPFYKWEIKEINFKSKTCLLPMVDADSSKAIELYEMFNKGLLAFSGGYLEQPAKYLKIMKEIRSYINNVKNTS